ncbi:MAG: hypothetical protein ACC707_10460, partial [Thiohalomonadales bacterium]
GGSVAQFFYNDASNKAKHLAGDASVQNLFFEYQGRKLNLNIGILAQDEDRNDFYTDGIARQSYSPQRASLLVEARLNLNPNNFVDLNLQTRRSDYPAMDAKVIARTDHRDIISLRYARRINKSYWIMATLNRIDNESVVNKYTSNSYQLGLSGTF